MPVGDAALGPWLAAGGEGREGSLEQGVHHLDVLHKVLPAPRARGEAQRKHALGRKRRRRRANRHR
eukprot:3046261-Rhodomonas_salina.1